MPQLDISTFSSQIFWVLVGFFLVYVFMSTVVAPSLKTTLDNRESHINGMLDRANKMKEDAAALEHDAFVLFENAQIDSRSEEEKLIEAFRRESLEEKSKLYDEFACRSQQDAEKLAADADQAIADALQDVDVLVQKAMEKIV